MKFRTLLTLLIATVSVIASAQTEVPKHRSNLILVKFKAGTPLSVQQSVHMQAGSTVLWTSSAIRVQCVRISPKRTLSQALFFYRSQSSIQYAELSRAVQKRDVPNDPDLGKQYGLASIKAFGAWDYNIGLPNVKIAIIDDGIDMDHPDLKDKIVDPFDPTDNDNNPSPNPADSSHGTHCAGIAAAATNNGIGMAGSGRNSSIMPIRVFDGPNAFEDWIIQAITYAADKGAKVISMSFGGYGKTSQPLQDAINYAWGKGVVLLAASGNDNSNDALVSGWPSTADNVINVGSTDDKDARSGFSNYGPHVHIAAPGSAIYSTVVNGYAFFDGTSMACPMAAGAVGVMWSRAVPGTTPGEIVAALLNSTDDVGRDWSKYGRINMMSSMRALAVKKTATAGPKYIKMAQGRALNVWSGVVTNDGQYFEMAPASVENLGLVGGAAFSFKVPVDITRVIDLTFATEAKYSDGATFQIYLYNFNNGRWTNLKSFPMSAIDETKLARLRPEAYANYVAPDGEVRALVRGLLPSSYVWNGQPFSVDFLEMRATYLEN